MVTRGKIESVTMAKIGVIEVLMTKDVDQGQDKKANLLLEICKKLLMKILEVDIGPRPETLPPINQVNMVDFFIYLLIIVVSMIVFITM